MSVGIQVKYLWTRQLGTKLVVLSMLFGGVAGCAQVGTPPVDLATPTLLSMPSPAAPVEATLPSPSGWEAYASQGTYSWILSPSTTDPNGPVRNFVYVSVIPDGLQSEAGEIYNYDPTEAETLLNMEVGESKPLRDDPNTAQWFTYARLPDTILNNHAAQTYENTQPWEFPVGTKEIRYYLQGNGCTYLIGGYLDTTGSNQSGGINEALFDQIIDTLRLTP